MYQMAGDLMGLFWKMFISKKEELRSDRADGAEGIKEKMIFKLEFPSFILGF